MMQDSFSNLMTANAMRLIARALAAGRLQTIATGVDHIPKQGPALLVARHYHHLFDGLALYAAVRRQLHILVTLDWTNNTLVRFFMKCATKAGRWPVVVRVDAVKRNGNDDQQPRRNFISLDDVARYQRRAMKDCLKLLTEGRLLVVFPEGYPNVDPTYTPKTEPDEFLPFKSGFAAIAAAAEKRLGASIPIIPVGLRYTEGEPWIAHINFGVAIFTENFSSRELLVKHLERQVRILSGLSVSETMQPLG
jgi:1-acyl-sn-glycerol-3-phosphate acyltransferase